MRAIVHKVPACCTSRVAERNAGMTAVRKVAYGCGLLLLAVVIVGVFLPSSARVERELLIDAPAATVFVLARQPRRLQQWSPWIDSSAAIEVERDVDNREVSLRWQTDRGDGRMTFIDSEPYRAVTSLLHPPGGRETRSTMELDETGEGTRVHWTLETDFGANLAARYAGLFFEGRAGDVLAGGLSELETLAESLPRADWSTTAIERLVVEPVDIAFLSATSLPNAAAISEAMGEAYFEVLGFIDRHNLEEAGAPLSISRRFRGSEFVFDAAIPVSGVTGATPRTENGIRLGQTYGGQVVRARHVGSYRTLADTHEKIAAWLAVHGIARAGDAWEAYVSDPTRVPEAQLVTDVYYPVEGR